MKIVVNQAATKKLRCRNHRLSKSTIKQFKKMIYYCPLPSASKVYSSLTMNLSKKMLSRRQTIRRTTKTISRLKPNFTTEKSKINRSSAEP